MCGWSQRAAVHLSAQGRGRRRSGPVRGSETYKSTAMSKTRIDKRFAKLRSDGRAALVTFLTAGDPDHDASLNILRSLPAAGADIVELGMPFTDPMADGPAIQLS